MAHDDVDPSQETTRSPPSDQPENTTNASSNQADAIPDTGTPPEARDPDRDPADERSRATHAAGVAPVRAPDADLQEALQVLGALDLQKLGKAAVGLLKASPEAMRKSRIANEWDDSPEQIIMHERTRLPKRVGWTLAVLALLAILVTGEQPDDTTALLTDLTLAETLWIVVPAAVASTLLLLAGTARTRVRRLR